MVYKNVTSKAPSPFIERLTRGHVSYQDAQGMSEPTRASQKISGSWIL